MMELLRFCLKNGLRFEEFNGDLCVKIENKDISLLGELKEILEVNDNVDGGTKCIIYDNYIAVDIFDSVALYDTMPKEKNAFYDVIEKIGILNN